MQETSLLPIVAVLGALSLLQGASGDPRPQFALAVNVPGTSRVSTAAGAANSAVAAINAAVQNYHIQSELTLLPEVAGILASIANQFQPLGLAVVSTISALAGDSSGNVATAFGAALSAVNAAIAFGDDTLPGLEAPLVPLVGTALTDKLDDAFQHVDKGLRALQASLTTLQAGAQAALVQAGSANVPANVVARRLPPSAVAELADALYLLRATVPLLQYVVASTMGDIALADSFMLQLDAKVNSIIGVSSTIALELNDFLDPLASTIASEVSSIGGQLSGIATEFAGLSNLATATSAAALGSALGDFPAVLGGLAVADPSIADILGQLAAAFSAAFDIADPLYYIYQSALVDALMTTLVANGDYSQYCFYKYKDFFFLLLDFIAYDASDCIAEEALRMEYYTDTVSLMFSLLFYDFMDISDNLEICERIRDPSNLQECTAKFVDIYTSLAGSFGDKVMLGYRSLQHEIAASGNRLKICIRLSQSELSDTEVPLLLDKIHHCAQLGPNAGDY